MLKKKLKLNEDKTECMLFGSNKSLKNFELLQQVKIGTSIIKTVPIVKDLGVLLDNRLTLKDNILNTVKICNYHIRNIAFIRKYLNENALKVLVNNHVISRLDYCNSIYYSIPNNLLKKLQNVQNRAARIIKGIKVGVHLR